MVRTLVVMSDIHGNLPALRAVAASVPAADRVIVAGDHCFEGPAPREVLDLLEELGWELLRGNTDEEIVHPPPGFSEEKARLAAWVRDQIGPEQVQLLEALPFSLRDQGEVGEDVLVVHANPRTTDEHLLPTMSEEELRPYLEGVAESVLAFGHLHTPYVRPVRGILLIDVSSVGHPKDRDLRSAYTVIRWEGGARTVSQVRVPYDVEEAVGLLRQSGMPGADEQIAALLKASY